MTTAVNGPVAGAYVPYEVPPLGVAIRDLEIPGVADAEDLVKAIDGTYGSAGLQLDGVHTGEFQQHGRKVNLRQQVLDADRRPVGKVSLYLWRDEVRRLHAEFGLVSLDPSVRRTGFGRALMEQGGARFAAMGVDEVHFTAALKDGGVTWAQIPGVEFKSRAPRVTVARIVAQSMLLRQIQPREGWQILRSDPRSPGEILAKGELGVRTLNHSIWSGVVKAASRV